jgi:hypothetical protein
MSMDKDISGKYMWKFLVEAQNQVNCDVSCLKLTTDITVVR